VDKNRVYITCHDGSSWCFDATSGSVVWNKKAQATSAPVIAHGQVVITQKQSRNNKTYEGVRRLDSARGEEKEARLLAAGEAAYLESGKGGGVALKAESVQALDASVGFSSPPAAANLSASSGHLGIGSVVAGWAYQGARAAIRDGRIVNAQGTKINVTDARYGDEVWEANLKGKQAAHDQQVFSPPALGKENMYLCSGSGHLLSVRQKDGKVQFLYGTDQPMTFQPALAEGNIYAGTSNGMVICIQTGSLDADGWTAWGGNAQHNKND
jgi:outer membrane protein assembly factor BamB